MTMHPGDEIITPYNEIETTDVLRYTLLEHGPDTPENETKVNALAKRIHDLLTQNVETLPFDFVLEQLARLGFPIAVLNDDNGNWAVVADGYQSAAFGDNAMDVDTHFWVSARHWKPTLREALRFFLEDEEDDDDVPTDEDIDDAMEGFTENNIE
jgi:hypothetical protein